MLQSIIEKLKSLVTNGASQPVTTTSAGALLVGALICIGYNFDADPATTTNWNTVGMLLTGAVAALFVRDPSAKKPDDTPPTP